MDGLQKKYMIFHVDMLRQFSLQQVSMLRKSKIKNWKMIGHQYGRMLLQSLYQALQNISDKKEEVTEGVWSYVPWWVWENELDREWSYLNPLDFLLQATTCITQCSSRRFEGYAGNLQPSGSPRLVCPHGFSRWMIGHWGSVWTKYASMEWQNVVLFMPHNDLMIDLVWQSTL